jgi:hypothetical protein
MGRLSRAVARCPRCAASALIDHPAIDRCEISWDAENHRFAVAMTIAVCGYCGPITEVVRHIPVIIAEKSVCSCGSALVLKSHSLRRQGDCIEFDGQYVCESCHESKNTLVQKIGDGLVSFWKKTKKIEVGPKGVSYEKDAGT